MTTFSSTTTDPSARPPVGDRPYEAGPEGLASSAGRSGGTGTPAADQRGVTDLIKELRDEATTLFRQEVQLAKTELSEKAGFFAQQGAKVGAGLGVAALGGLLVIMAVAFFVSAIIQAIFDVSDAVAFGIGFLLVGGAIAAVGYALYSSASAKMKRETLVPERTIQSLKEDKQWLTNQPQTHSHNPTPATPPSHSGPATPTV